MQALAPMAFFPILALPQADRLGSEDPSAAKSEAEALTSWLWALNGTFEVLGTALTSNIRDLLYSLFAPYLCSLVSWRR